MPPALADRCDVEIAGDEQLAWYDAVCTSTGAKVPIEAWSRGGKEDCGAGASFVSDCAVVPLAQPVHLRAGCAHTAN